MLPVCSFFSTYFLVLYPPGCGYPCGAIGKGAVERVGVVMTLNNKWGVKKLRIQSRMALMCLAVAGLSILLITLLHVSVVYSLPSGGTEETRLLMCGMIASTWRVFAGVLVILGVLMPLLGWLAGRRLTRSLGELTEGVRKMAGGDLEHRVGSVQGLEFNRLADDLNAMARQLNAARSELELRREMLDDLVALRTRELERAKDALEKENAARRKTEDRLSAALEVAESATRAKSAFLANMSHEIRTPLNAIIGLTDLLGDTSLTTEQLDYIETVKMSSETLLTIINDVLDLSKVEAGELQLEEQPFDIRKCVESSLDLVAGRAAEKDLELAFTIDNETPNTLIGDVIRLRQVLVNLLGNAVKFTEAGEVFLAVTSTLLEEGCYEVRFAVRDTGIGMTPEQIERIFEPFKQADSSTTRKYGGTGLGLSICRRLIHLMDGQLSVESEPGLGATFFFTIRAEAGPQKKMVYLQGRQPVLEGKRVLLVDDNRTNRQILEHQLARWGMTVTSAGSGAEALERLAVDSDFQLAILDMHMPEMDGVMLAGRIQQTFPPDRLPLMMLTSMGDRRGGTEVEFAAYLCKPVKPLLLHETLAEVLRGRTGRASDPAAVPEHIEICGSVAQERPLSILLAEDNRVNQMVALRMLARMGYTAETVENGREALQWLDAHPADVVLMDVQMPEMDGLQTAGEIRKKYGPDRPHIIGMTAHALLEDRRVCLESGMQDYLSKPVRIDALARALYKAALTLQRIKAAECA